MKGKFESGVLFKMSIMFIDLKNLAMCKCFHFSNYDKSKVLKSNYCMQLLLLRKTTIFPYNSLLRKTIFYSLFLFIP